MLPSRQGTLRGFFALTLFTSTLSMFAQSAPKGETPQPATASNPAGENSNSGLPVFQVMTHPTEQRLQRGRSFEGDLRTLPQVPPEKFERPELEQPEATPVPYPGTAGVPRTGAGPIAGGGPSMTPPAPPPSISFEGLDFGTFGAGHPPDTNGDVGPIYYIQTINTSIGIYNKSTGVRVTAFSFNTFLNGHFGNLCDTNNFGDPVVVYDTFEDRWVITDFAFMLSGGFPVAPAYQCFAVSKSGDPVGGGWNFYSIQFSGGLGDYPKFGIWPDGLYMSANMFGFGPGGSFQNVRVWAFNKAQMYAGASTVQVLSFDAPSNEFTLLPANARLQTGTPPAGSPNYFAVVWRFLNVVSVYKFQVNWNSISTSTFSGPFTSITATLWAQYTGAGGTVPSPANNLDSLYPRLMMQNQYSNIGGVESLWTSHTVGAGNPISPTTSGQAAVRYYQVKVTGGTVESNATQSFTYSPDATLFRFMPSVEVDRAGDMAIGYSASNATTNPAIRYAGRLAGDLVNSITQTETSLIDGTGSQLGNCGGSACTRWGDYSAMTLDPDGCTFWYTNMYYQVNGLNHHTRIGAFSFPSCTPASTGTLQGNVTASGSGNPIQGATVALGSRTTTTDASGNYSFTGLPSGTYPSLTASFPGYISGSATNIVVNDGSTTTQNFPLTLAPTSGCLTDTTQADFQTGVPTNCDLTSSPGDVILSSTANIDQQNTTVTNSGFGFNSTNWAGQTFMAGVAGQLTRVDLKLFCAGCTGTTPNITVSIRATSGSPAVPTGADLATATITGFSSGVGIYYSANFSSPPTLSAGTTYAVIFRAVSNPSAGSYAYVCSCSTPDSNPYPNGQRVTSADSGATWTADIVSGGRDLGFKTYMKTGFVSSGTFVSSLKDANPATGVMVHWNTLSWTAAIPANTAIQFQAAASNTASGPFNFVGPDGTAGTFFTNGGSLAQFNGNRYLKYEAFLTTTNNAVTPTLNDVTVCFTNGKGNTATALASSTNPSVFGQTVTFTAMVSAVPPATGTPTGTVTFLDGASPIGAGVLSGGQATFMTSALTAGTHTIAATYGGDPNFNGSTGSLTGNPQVVSRANTLVGLAASPPSPSNFPVTVTFTATITVVPPGAGTPTGTVTFRDGATLLGSTFFSGTTATFSTNALSIGTHTITATYNGDSNFNGSTSTVLNYTVNATTTVAANTNVTATVSPIKRLYAIGGQVTFTITVSTDSVTGVHAVLNLSPDGAPTQVVGNPVADTGVNCTGGAGAIQCDIANLQAGTDKHVQLTLQIQFSDFRTFTGIAAIAANTTGDSGTHYAADQINVSFKPFGR